MLNNELKEYEEFFVIENSTSHPWVSFIGKTLGSMSPSEASIIMVDESRENVDLAKRIVPMDTY